MKQLLTILAAFTCLSVSAQYSPTGAKTAFKNGIALGSKDSTSFAANDSLTVTIDRNGKFMWRGLGASAVWRVPLSTFDTSGMLSVYTRLTRFSDSLTAIRSRINGGGVLFTAAQPNITSLGTLIGLTMGGPINMQSNNISNGGDFTFTNGNVTNTLTLPSVSTTPSAATIGYNSTNGTYLYPRSGASFDYTHYNGSGGAVWSNSTGSTSFNANGKIVSLLGNNQEIFRSASATTGFQFMSIVNGSGNTLFGTEGSSGGNLLTGGTAYATVLTSAVAKNVEIGVNQVRKLWLDGTTGDVTSESKIYAKSVATGTGSDSILTKGVDGEIKKISQSSIAGGTGTSYSPSFTNVSGTSSFTLQSAQYSRTGDVVTVSGAVAFTSTGTGGLSFTCSLPVVSTFTNVGRCGGSFTESDGTFTGVVKSNNSTTATFAYTEASATSRTVWFHFTYLVQ